MDIAITNLAGVRKHFYEFPSDVAAALIHAGIAVQIVKPAPAPVVRTWSVGHPPYGPDVWIIVWSSNDGARQYFTGDPAVYLKNPPQHCGSVCPQEIVEQYARLKNSPVPFVGLTDSQRNADAVRQQKEKEQSHRWM